MPLLKLAKPLKAAGICPYCVHPTLGLMFLMQREHDTSLRRNSKRYRNNFLYRDYGGSAEPTDPYIEWTAAREFHEETGGKFFSSDSNLYHDSNRYSDRVGGPAIGKQDAIQYLAQDLASNGDYIIMGAYVVYFVKTMWLKEYMLPSQEDTQWGPIRKEHRWFTLRYVLDPNCRYSVALHPRLQKDQFWQKLGSIGQRYYPTYRTSQPSPPHVDTSSQPWSFEENHHLEEAPFHSLEEPPSVAAPPTKPTSPPHLTRIESPTEPSSLDDDFYSSFEAPSEFPSQGGSSSGSSSWSLMHSIGPRPIYSVQSPEHQWTNQNSPPLSPVDPFPSSNG